MKQSLGQKLSQLRKENGYTQDEIAARLGVTPQAVSKWENDQSCPDIMLLPTIARLYHVTVDDLFAQGNPANAAAAAQPTAEQTRPSFSSPAPKPVGNARTDNLFLKVFVDSVNGDDVKVQIPVPVIQALVHMGIQIPELSNIAGLDLKQIDLNQIFALIDNGVCGELVRVETADGSKVRVVVEEL